MYAFSILFLIMLIAIILTWIVPAGSFAKLAYNRRASTGGYAADRGELQGAGDAGRT